MAFLEQLPSLSGRYLFAVANHGGQVSNTLVQLQKSMEAGGFSLSSGWSVELPSNYIPWGGPGSVEEQQALFAAARLKISSIARGVREQVKKPMEKGPLWQRIVFTWIYKLSFDHVSAMDKSFWTDERCNQCQLCVDVCPSENIILQDDKLVWQNHCEQCLACIQWCPKESLQYGKKTPAYARYHHPEIKIKDLIK